MSDYISHIILLSQDADWTWYETLRPYIEAFRVTITKSADDAGSFHGTSHTVTIIQTPGAWPDGIVPFFQTHYPNARLDVLTVATVNDLAPILAQRTAGGESTRYTGGQIFPATGPAPAGSSTYDSHILLMPNGCDWNWYRAAQDYLLHYRVTVAQSADDAGSFHGRNHVVTAIDFPGAYNGSIQTWFQTNYPDAKVDYILAATQPALTTRLAARLAHDDRFGEHEPYSDPATSFQLRWPLDPALINTFGAGNKPWNVFSRLFGASPWAYRRADYPSTHQGLPAHEGLDFQAPIGTQVFACADGTVFAVDNVHANDPDNFPYGFHVRLRHTFQGNVYETLYAHLSQVAVALNQNVIAGQPIGQSGQTGRASGPHLHLNLKSITPNLKTGTYPDGIIDPQLVLQWPDGWVLKPRSDLPNLYGVHDELDEGPEAQKAGSIMQQVGVRGYLLWTEAIGDNPNDQDGVDYRPRVIGDHTVIVRLNNGYGSEGTLPLPAQYTNFAKRCGNFARNSHGVNIYVIGNEMNNPGEWPQGQPITPENYALCFNQVYQQIKAADPNAIVCSGAVDPYNAAMFFPPINLPSGDMRVYIQTMLNNITQCDGLAIHAYTHGPDPKFVEDQGRVFGNHPYETVRYHFWVFEDVMNAIPARFKNLPVYMTETDHFCTDANNQDNTHGWSNVNSGWVWSMYQQVDEWNKRGGQQICCALVYRYPPRDEWVFSNKPGVVQDFKDALTLKLRPYQRR
jgi:murein DD-endopeptidase MepM/ murein hydrolase activator NlpD